MEYAGGYSDALMQRGEVTAEVVKGKTRQAALPQTKAEPAARLSFKQLHELKTLTAEIEALHAAISRHESTLAAPGLYARDAKKFNAVTSELADAQARLAAAESRWLELELLREAS